VFVCVYVRRTCLLVNIFCSVCVYVCVYAAYLSEQVRSCVFVFEVAGVGACWLASMSSCVCLCVLCIVRLPVFVTHWSLLLLTSFVLQITCVCNIHRC
jgi:hypothetical protein